MSGPYRDAGGFETVNSPLPDWCPSMLERINVAACDYMTAHLRPPERVAIGDHWIRKLAQDGREMGFALDQLPDGALLLVATIVGQVAVVRDDADAWAFRVEGAA